MIAAPQSARPADPVYAQPAPTAAEPRNALGITALILGIVGIMFGFVPLTGFVAFALGVTGLILALAARGRLRRGTATNKKSTLGGGIVSVIAIGLGTFGMVTVFTAVDKLDRDLKEIEESGDRYVECLERAESLQETEACEELVEQ